MNRERTDHRIESALQLQPMTVEMLAKCLTLEHQVVRRTVGQMRSARRLRVIHVKPLVTIKPWVFYSLASASAGGFCQAQSAEGRAATTTHITPRARASRRLIMIEIVRDHFWACWALAAIGLVCATRLIEARMGNRRRS